MKMTAISINQLKKTYRSTVVVDQVSFDLHHGEALGLLGANGAGKSTMIKCMLGLVMTDQGTVKFSAQPPAYLPENPQLPLSLSAMDLIQFKCASLGMECSHAENTLNQLGLPPAKHHSLLRTYSKGMRQRAALAFALCGKPASILLDEPMSGLDALGRAEVLTLLKQRKQAGMACLMCSHIVPDMVQLCDRILIMAHGKACEEIVLSEHSMQQVALLEERLAYWQVEALPS